MKQSKSSEMDAQALAITLCGIDFRNPVLAASGTFGYGIEFERLVDLNALGGIVVKGLSRAPIRGNPAPRLWEACAGMINSVGLQNIGGRRDFNSLGCGTDLHRGVQRESGARIQLVIGTGVTLEPGRIDVDGVEARRDVSDRVVPGSVG